MLDKKKIKKIKLDFLPKLTNVNFYFFFFSLTFAPFTYFNDFITIHKEFSVI
jgi:hypothetical protein